jgi:plasmid maintenance system antidote protein VapI
MQPTYHIQFLLNDLQMRKTKNKNYSLRAYASKLGIHPSALSRIFAGKQELSISCCIEIVPKLEFTEEQLKQFLLSIVAEKREKMLERFEKSFSITLRDEIAQRIS